MPHDSAQALADLESLTPTELACLSDEERAELLGLAAVVAGEPPVTLHDAPPPDSLRAFAAEWCGVEYSPLAAAIADASEGRRPDTIDDAACARHFGCKLDELPAVARRTVAVRAGGRGGKTSRLLAIKALHAALTVPLPTLRKGEHAVSLILSSELVFAHQALSFCEGYVSESPQLRALLVGEPTKSRLTLRRPSDGKLVDIRVRAAGKGGKGGRAFTLAFAGMDEAAFFDSEGAAVSDRETYRSAIQRLVPGAQCWVVSTPWVAHTGLLEELIEQNYGVHVHALAVTAPTRALNPTWDPDGTIEAQMRATDPDNADREIGAIPLSGSASTWFSHDAIKSMVDEHAPIEAPRSKERQYFAGGDFGFRRNSSALSIVDDTGALALLREIKPEQGMPLKPAAVCKEFAADLLRYDVRHVTCDSHERAEVEAELGTFGISVVAAPEGQPGKVAVYKVTRTELHEGRLRIPRLPRLVAQLQQVRGRPMPGGGTSITSPQRSTGEHGDLVSAYTLSVHASVERGGARDFFDAMDSLP